MACEIKKALDGLNYKYFPNGKNKQVEMVGFSKDEYLHYFSVFEYSRKLGLPNGKGWFNELPWIPHFLSYMMDIYDLVGYWMRSKNIGNSKEANAFDFMSNGG